MIVHRHDLQALQCDVYERTYEVPRSRGCEDDLAKLVDFKKRLGTIHAKCKPKDENDAVLTMDVERDTLVYSTR